MSELDATVDSLRALELLRPMTPKYIVLFFSLALLLGWIGYAPSFLSSYGLLDWPLPLIVAFVIIGGGSPTFAELITTRLEHGRDGPASLFRQFNPKGVPRVWFVVSLALPVGMCLCVVGLWLALGNTYKLDVGLPAEEIPLLLSNLAVNTWGGGSRGYALPMLQRKHSALVSSLVVGRGWALWHAPLFFMKDSRLAANYDNSFALPVGTILLHAILYTWLYNSSRNNLLVVSIFHAAINTANIILLSGAGIAHDASLTYLLVVGVVAGIVLAVFKPRYLTWRNKGKPPHA